MRWKVLPESLDPHARQLVGELRGLKDHSGLSLKSLQAKTPFSRSSWERYLNGKVLPPQAAVEALARIAGADVAPLLALRDAAERTWTTASVTPAESGSPAQERKPEIRVAALSVAAGALLLAATTSVLLITDPWRAHVPATGEPGVAGVGTYTCRYTRHGDQLFAGNSSTTSRLVMRNTTGTDAAEVQCLLLRHKLSPGDVDGYFGARTEAAVKRLQRQDHVPDDGIVGEQTWALLRHVE
ncbi:peptidoglycan-binding protein [Streptomyces sioyaensis]|uniref:Peptidoglycan-binding protein n=1 Tax=Streptomyces sioyaensis TaxID=67364 RepID=A0A4Q1QM69_9ACTN|nr:peptidoglycan-binding protein [Streptomyces sioyaensis]MBM4790843.1 peptidoglycan-binding protein [Streptomyces sioyaensis]RXS63962.1 peptidoglycan-binding protein [Streptomyces sioyaensis]